MRKVLSKWKVARTWQAFQVVVLWSFYARGTWPCLIGPGARLPKLPDIARNLKHRLLLVATSSKSALLLLRSLESRPIVQVNSSSQIVEGLISLIHQAWIWSISFWVSMLRYAAPGPPNRANWCHCLKWRSPSLMTRSCTMETTRSSRYVLHHRRWVSLSFEIYSCLNYLNKSIFSC